MFYDLDTPVTLEKLAAGERPSYIHPSGLGGFNLVLSYTGGVALDELRTRLNAQRVAPLYGSVDPESHQLVRGPNGTRFDLSYLGTYASDRQDALEELFITPARRLPEKHVRDKTRECASAGTVCAGMVIGRRSRTSRALASTILLPADDILITGKFLLTSLRRVSCHWIDEIQVTATELERSKAGYLT